MSPFYVEGDSKLVKRQLTSQWFAPTSHYSQAHSGIEDYELEVSMTCYVIF